MLATDGLTELQPQGTSRTLASVRSADKKLSKERSGEIRSATPQSDLEWCDYAAEKRTRKQRRPVEQE